MFDVSVKLKETRVLQKELSSIPSAVDKAGVRVANSAAMRLEEEIPHLIAKDYHIKAASVKKDLSVNLASKANKRAEVVGDGKEDIPLLEFTIRKYQTGSSTRPGPDGKYTPAVGVPIKIKRTEGMEAEPGLFTQTVSGHVGLFKQNPNNPKKIKEQFFPNPLFILDEQRYEKLIQKAVDNEVQSQLPRQIEKELRNEKL